MKINLANTIIYYSKPKVTYYQTMSDKDIFIGVRFGIAAIRRLASIKIDLGSFESDQ